MLENIKTSYFINKFSSFVDERKKLEIIKYNKNIQKLMNISILNYKIFCGRYFIKEGNIMKEYSYYNDQLEFEGEYLNGKRNGKGKEYFYNFDGVFSIEVSYKNGEKNGFGKKYLNNQLIFEGEYLYGKKMEKEKNIIQMVG